MVSKINITMLMAVMFLAIAYTALSQGKNVEECNKECMPTCLKVEEATVSVCEKVCKDFCQEQGSNLSNQVTTDQLGSKTANFDTNSFMQKTREYLAIRKKARKVQGNKKPFIHVAGV